jgi:WD40 repeat protein
VKGDEVLSLGSEEILCVAWSPDGQRLAASSFSRAWVWEAHSGEEILQLKGHDGPVDELAWSPESRYLASASRDQTIGIWDAQTGARVRVLRGHTDWVQSVAWSPDGQRLASASYDGTVKLWNADKQPLDRLTGVEAGSLLGAAQSPDGKRIATRDRFSESVTVWDAATGAKLTTLDPHRDASANTVEIPKDPWWPGAVSWSPDSRLIAAANSSDGKARIWDARVGQENLVLGDTANPVKGHSWSPDGRHLASTGSTIVQIWDTRTGREVFSLRGHEADVKNAAWSPDGYRLASASWDGTVRIWDVATGGQLMILRGHASGKWIAALAWSPDGRQLASAGWDQTIKIWGTDSGKEEFALRGHTAPIEAVAWSPDGQRLASAGWDGIKIWDPTEAREIITLMQGRANLQRGVHWFAWSASGRQLSMVSGDGAIQRWDASRGYTSQVQPSD